MVGRMMDCLIGSPTQVPQPGYQFSCLPPSLSPSILSPRAIPEALSLSLHQQGPFASLIFWANQSTGGPSAPGPQLQPSSSPTEGQLG